MFRVWVLEKQSQSVFAEGNNGHAVFEVGGQVQGRFRGCGCRYGCGCGSTDRGD